MITYKWWKRLTCKWLGHKYSVTHVGVCDKKLVITGVGKCLRCGRSDLMVNSPEYEFVFWDQGRDLSLPINPHQHQLGGQ